MSDPMRMAYRDDGFWILFWHAVSSLWNNGHSATYPPAHFVGLVSSLSQASDPRPHKLTSIALRKLPSTLDGRGLWRLTYGWEISPRARHLEKSGRLSVTNGSEASQVHGGVGISTPRT